VAEATCGHDPASIRRAGGRSIVSHPATRRQPADVPTALHVRNPETTTMNQIVYIVGAVVIIMALLAFFGLR
jgi:hypothetical protein